MRIDEALRIARYARKPIAMSPDSNGRPKVDYWLVATDRGYFDRDPAGFTICYPDMVPRMQPSSWDIERYLFGGADDWEPYPVRYVIDFRRRFTQNPLRSGGWKPINF